MFFRRGSAPTWFRRAIALTTAVLASSVVVLACSGTDPFDPPHAGTGGGGVGGGTGAGGPCAEGAVQDCHVTIGEHDGVLTCLDGEQTCAGGVWTPCNGTTTTRSLPRGAPPVPTGENPIPLSLTDAGACIDNPCDPSCQQYTEDPGPGGVTIPPVAPPYPWDVGDINALPPSVIDKGTSEPCTTAEDCQFDQVCDNPARGACAHHPCATGTGLFSSCSPCVQKICNATPTCCQPTYVGDCLHDPCVQGSALGTTCDACVTSICAARPGCCTPLCTSDADCQTLVGPTSTCDAQGRCSCGAPGPCPTGSSCNSSSKCVPFWGSGSCVSQVSAICGKTCPGPAIWSAACASQVNSVCGATCDAPSGTCAHDICYSGDKLASGCDVQPPPSPSCVQQICTTAAPAGDPTCCTTEWTQSCVDKVKSLCGIACPAKGQCEAWLPDDYDTSCAGIDLTLAVPCGGYVPVCNRGSSPVPAGTTINVAAYGAGSNEIASSAPSEVLTSCDPTPVAPACTITLAAQLDPGQCVNIDNATNCAGALTPDMELMVNPPGAGQLAECHCENNWSIYQTNTCTSPACIASASVSLIRRVSMFVAIDRSTSMLCSGTPGCGSCLGTPALQDRLTTRWNPVKNALNTFFQDPNSAGLGVALRFWPDGACNDPGCPTGPAGDCAVPEVALGTLLAASGDPQETLLVNAVNAKTACGNTPMYAALDGATNWAIARKTANPDEEVVVVFVTDGIPTHCNTSNLAIANLAGNAFQNYGIRTYAIGVSTQSNPTQIDQIAYSGGGSSFFLDDTLDATGAILQQSLLSAMLSIRGDALPCDITIPIAGLDDADMDGYPDDYSEIDMVWTDSGGMTTTLPYVADPAFCAGGGWYVDALDPGLARLCPSTCAMVQADLGGKVQAVVECISTYSPYSYTQTYKGQCPAGSKVQWGYLTYDATTPSDSNVVFRVRTAETEAALTSVTNVTVATAQATPDTQLCHLTGTPGCPIDLYASLGGLPDARNDYLELTMTLNPSGDGMSAPTVQNWEITYSCPFSE